MLPVLGFERGISASVIGTIMGAFAIAAAIVRVILPMLAGRIREWALLSAAMLVTAVLFALYPLMPTALAMGACSVVLGAAMGMVQPMVMSTLHQITPEARHGEALGLRLMTINASSVVMPLLFGTLGAAIGVASVFWIAGVGVAFGARSAWRLKDSLQEGKHLH